MKTDAPVTMTENIQAAAAEAEPEIKAIPQGFVAPGTTPAPAPKQSFDDKALDKIFGTTQAEQEADDVDPGLPEIAYPDQGKPVAKPKPEPKPAPLKQTDPDVAEGEGETEDADPIEQTTRPARRADDADYLEAMATLRREGWTRKAIEAVADSDGRQKVLDIAATRRQVQLDRDKLSGELRRQGQQQPSREAVEPKAENAAEARKPNPQPNLDIARRLQPLIADLREAGNPLVEILTEMDARLNSAAAPQPQPDVKPLVDHVLALTDKFLASETKAVRAELQNEIPQLKDPKVWQEVRTRAEKLVRAGVDEDVETAMRNAVKDILGDPIQTAQRLKAEGLAQRRDAGSIAKPQTGPTPPKRSREERENASLDALFSNKGLDAARSAYG